MKKKLCCLAAMAVALCVASAQSLFDTPFSIIGTGGDKDRRESDPVELAPGTTHLFSFTARRVGGGKGAVVAGPACMNVDFSVASQASEPYRFVFRTPEDCTARQRFHLGGWRMTGEVAFETASVRRVKAIWAKSGGITLGHGETVDGNLYTFTAPLGSAGRNDSRPLLSHNAWFNTQRWCMTAGKHVTYRHALDGRRFLTGKASVTCGYHVSGGVTVEAATDGGEWTFLGTLTNTTTVVFDVPAALLPAAEIRIRIKGLPKTNMQVYGYSFDGRLDGKPTFALGYTRYIDAETGEQVECLHPSTYYDEDYGELLSDEGGITLWSASSAHKVPPRRRPPTAWSTGGLAIRTAANESEAVQLIVSPRAELKNVRVVPMGDLTSGTARIPASAVDIRRVGYVHITQPTDTAGCRAWWPDPLLPQDITGCTVRACESQPFRVRVKPPKGTPKGLYRGRISVTSSAGALEVPLAVEVFGFDLPDTMTCETAFGFSPGMVFRYHGLKKEKERRQVLDKYMRLLADNHISPYDPAPIDRWKVTWKGLKENPLTAEPQFDWSAWDVAMEKAFREYRFNTVKINVEGLGAGTFHSRCNPSYMGYSPTNEAYHVLMSKYLGGIEAHLREKGWLDKAYVYWFDEPAPRDYEFVMEGFRTLKRHAPGIRRMLTEQPEPELVGGPNLWCTLTPRLHSAEEPRCRAAGDHFWWYVCCAPKKPYVTEFIDHPGVEMRLWSWQTWKENVHGLLIWQTTYWTSDSAYPDGLQNPYEDPMSWVSSYSTPKGVKIVWGNGDGRLIYPPPTAADGRSATPVMDDPVPSFRLEMLGDGIEDYEYFAMLKRNLATASEEDKATYSPLLSVPETVTKTMTDFSVDPEPLESYRVRLARALERLKSRSDP